MAEKLTSENLSQVQLTSVWMSCERCSRILETNPNTLSFCSACIMSIMASITMKVPVLPTPALQGHKQTPDWVDHNPQLTLVRQQTTMKAVKQRDICARCYRHSKCFQPRFVFQHTQSKYLTLNIMSSIETNWIIKSMNWGPVKTNHSHKQQNNKQRSIGSAFQYLQWTIIGPEKVGLTVLTFLRNLSMPMGEKGTPKSGQLVKWSWVTGLGVLEVSLAC